MVITTNILILAGVAVAVIGFLVVRYFITDETKK